MRVFDVYAASMGIGDQQREFSGSANGANKLEGTGSPGDQVSCFAMGRHDVESRVTFPIVQAVELQRAEYFPHVGEQALSGLVDGERMR